MHRKPAERVVGCRVSAPPSEADSPRLFDRISPRYDLLNRLLSFGMDLRWRRRVARHVREGPHGTLLDLACGTCDLVIAALDAAPDIHTAVAIDTAGRMLEIGRRKIAHRGLRGRASIVRGDGRRLPVADGTIDFATIAFGIRNIPEPLDALGELHRTLRAGGRIAVLEFSIPGNPLIRAAYLVYFRHVLPRVGGLVSGDAGAYRYLNRTVESFPRGEAFVRMMRRAGFEAIRVESLTCGVATLYCGEKR